MRHGTFNQRDKDEFNAMMARHDQLLAHQERKQAIKRMESKVTEPVKDNTGKGEAMSFIDDFKKQNKDTVQEDEDDTWISDTALTKDDKVRASLLTSKGFFLNTLKGQELVPWLSFSWWRQLLTFFFSDQAYKLNIQLLLLGIQHDDARLELSKHYLAGRKLFKKDNIDSVIAVINDNFIVEIPDNISYIESRELYTKLTLDALDELKAKQYKEVESYQLSYRELVKQSAINWKPTDTSQVYTAFIYGLIYQLREKEIKAELRKLVNIIFKKGQFIARNKNNHKIKDLQADLERTIATPTWLTEEWLTKEESEWTLARIGGSLLAEQSEDIIKYINTYFHLTSKKKV